MSALLTALALRTGLPVIERYKTIIATFVASNQQYTANLDFEPGRAIILVSASLTVGTSGVTPTDTPQYGRMTLRAAAGQIGAQLVGNVYTRGQASIISHNHDEGLCQFHGELFIPRTGSPPANGIVGLQGVWGTTGLTTANQVGEVSARWFDIGDSDSVAGFIGHLI